METSKNSAHSIMTALQDMSEQKGQLDAALWLSAAMKLRVLIQNEQDALVDMEREVQEVKAIYLSEGDTASAAKIKVESSDLYVKAKKQEIFIKTALDTILLAKKFATVETDIYKAH